MARNTDATWQELGAEPAAPPSGMWKIYPKADGFYILDDAGNETKLSTAGDAIGKAYSLFVMTDTDVVISNTNTEETLLGAGIGNPSVLPFVSAPADLLRWTLGGYLSTAGSAVDLLIDFKLNSVSLVDSGWVSPPTGLSNAWWKIELTMVFKNVGASSPVTISGALTIVQAGASSVYPLFATSDFDLDSETLIEFDWALTWDTADPDNAWTTQYATLERISHIS